MDTPWKARGLLEGKTIVVTGCSSGIGLETARVVKQLGGDVIGVDRNMTTEHVDELYRADLSDPRQIKALVKALPTGLHGLANIAGVPPTAPAALVLKVNLVGLKALTLGLIPKLADGASIVNLASLAGFGWPKQVASIRASAELEFDEVDDFVRQHDAGAEGGRSYFFSKEALVAWTLQNRWTWRARGIRMNAVSPGPVDTPILQDFVATLGARAEEDMRVMDRPGTPQDIAPVVAFLLSDMSGWIRGSNIPVDGGMSSHILCNLHGL
jgi:NAD(P)-dependent dehydrogenase (short-subunit alcohol dehydrogenase family)